MKRDSKRNGRVQGVIGERACGRGCETRRGMSGRSLRTRAAVLLCALTAFVYTGCGASKGGDSGASITYDQSSSASGGGAMYGVNSVPEYEAGEFDMEEYKSADSAVFEEAPENPGALEGRKLIRTVGLEAETREFDQMMSSLEEQVGDLGGYIENMETYNGSSYSDYVSSRYASLTVRIPSGKLDLFLQTVSDISNVVRRRDNVEDVTLSYVDMESRRNTLRTEQERLMSFLEKAETIEEIITIEERLSEVRYQLESMESQLRTLDNLIDYSTVNINVSEVRELTQIQEEEPGPGKRIADGFMGSLRDIGDGLMESAIWFLTHIPYLVIWAAVIAAALAVWMKARKRRLAKKAAREQEAQARMEARRMQEWEDTGAVGGAELETGEKKEERHC